jgi:hypothetical protein
MGKATPTRLSAYDLNYDPEFARRLIISLDDVERTDVVAYDVECGIVTRYAKDGAGNLKVCRATGEAITEEARGEVVVILKPV